MMLAKDMVIESAGGRLRLVGPIDAGAQAEVWRVVEVGGSGRSLAAKLISAKFQERDSQEYQYKKTALNRERGLLSEARHRFVAKFLYQIEFADTELDVVVEGFVMELATVGSLRYFLSDKDSEAVDHISTSNKMNLLRQIASALSHLHDIKIVHSDIKAENVLLVQEEAREFVPVLIDFGGAFRAHEPWPGLRTERYSAPELIEGKTASYASDMYAFGVLALEVLAGKRFFAPSPSDAESVRLPGGLSSYSKFIARLLSNDPASRPNADRTRNAFKTRAEEWLRTLPETSNVLKFPIGRTVWHPQVHRSLGLEHILVFLKGTRPTPEARMLKKVLSQKGLQGVAIRRFFGNYDFLIQAWADEAGRTLLNRGIEDFQNRQGTRNATPKIVTCSEYKYFCELPKIDVSRGEFLQSVYERFELEAPKLDLERYRLRPFERYTGENTFFLTVHVRSSAQPTPKALRIFFDHVCEYVRNRNKSLTRSQRQRSRAFLSESVAEIFIEVRCSSVQRYKDIMLGVAKYIQETNPSEEFTFEYSTHIDIDGDCFLDADEDFFSDDGMIPNFLLDEYC
ncbi:MAG: serine/threonine-protein kinase [Roseomonas sp.]|nr:serine/threonine-protein kinase [Roseomonas sp.]